MGQILHENERHLFHKNLQHVMREFAQGAVIMKNVEPRRKLKNAPALRSNGTRFVELCGNFIVAVRCTSRASMSFFAEKAGRTTDSSC